MNKRYETPFWLVLMPDRLLQALTLWVVVSFAKWRCQRLLLKNAGRHDVSILCKQSKLFLVELCRGDVQLWLLGPRVQWCPLSLIDSARRLGFQHGSCFTTFPGPVVLELGHQFAADVGLWLWLQKAVATRGRNPCSLSCKPVAEFWCN